MNRVNVKNSQNFLIQEHSFSALLYGKKLLKTASWFAFLEKNAFQKMIYNN